MNIFFLPVLIFELLLVIAGIYMIWSWINQTPFYPSSARRLVNLINSGEIKLPEHPKFVDIGSGDGRIVDAMANLCEISEGVEFNPYLSLWSKLKLFLKRKQNTKIYNQDFFKHDFSKYNVAYLYIFNEQIHRLQKKLFEEMPKGSILITNTFKIKDVEPDKKLDRIYLYYVK